VDILPGFVDIFIINVDNVVNILGIASAVTILNVSL
jgi:hypothetical protein